MENISNDEIDLQELGVSVIRYFLRHIRFILISIFLGMTGGVVAYFLLPPVFESEMILMSDILTESYSDRIAQTLNRLIKEGNFTALASKLNLSLEQARQIKAIDIESVKKKTEADTKEATIFIVTVEIGDETLLPGLQQGFIDFLRNNEYVKIRVKQRETYYNTLIGKLDKEIGSLDSLKQRLFTGKQVYSERKEMLLVDPTSIYIEIIDLTKLRAEYKNSLEIINSIQLVEGFTLFEKPKNPKLSVSLAVGFGFGFVGSILILTLMHLIKLALKDE